MAELSGKLRHQTAFMLGLRYRFESFELDPVAGTLSFEGADVRLIGKPFELLLLLARSGGKIVTRQEAVAGLWPETTVHENSLAVALSTLRHALARVYPARPLVETVPRRGYRLAAQVREVPCDAKETSALVGRDGELQSIRELALAARSGKGSFVWISGEPGIGKSALLECALADLARVEPATICGVGKCVDLHGASEPFFSIIEAIGEILRGPAGELAGQSIVTHCPHWCLHYPGHFAGHDVVERLQREGSLIDAPVLIRQLCDALSALAARAPLVLLLEDLHWVDSATADFLRVLAGRLPRERLLVLGTFRAASPTAAPPLLQAIVHPSERRLAQVLQLSRLDESSVRGLIEREHPEASARSAELAHWLWKKSEGLPLFVVRLLRSAVDGGALSDSAEGRSRARLETVLAESPPSVSGFIRQQLSSLLPTRRPLLELASVIGDEFLCVTLAWALDRTEDAVEDELDALGSGHQLVLRLREEELPDGRVTARFRFCHALVRAELYASLTARGRIELHGRVADALVLPPLDGSDHARSDHRYHPRAQAELAFHLERARRFAHAVVALLRAGDYCDRRFAKQQALVYYERARQLLSKTSSAEQAVFRLLIAQSNGWAKYGLGELDQARSEFRTANTWAVELQASEREPATRRALELGFGYLDVEWEDPLLRRPTPMLAEEAPSLGVHALRAEAYFGECAALFRAERFPELLVVAGELLALGRLAGNARRQAEALAWLGSAQLEIGELDRAKGTLDDCLALAQSLGHVRGMDMGARARAVLHVLHGQLDPAAEHYTAIRQRTALSQGAAHCLAELGDIRCKQGRLREAFAHHAEALELARGAIGTRAVPNTGWIYRELGAPREGLELDQQALDSCPPDEARRRRLLSYSIATSLARLGDCQGAERALLDVRLPESLQNSFFYLQHEWMAQCELHNALAQHEPLVQRAHAWHRAAQANDAPEGMQHALCFLARAALAERDLERARGHVEAGLALARNHPMPLLALRLLGQCELVELQSGQRSAAKRARESARAISSRLAASIDDATLQRTFREICDPRRTIESKN